MKRKLKFCYQKSAASTSLMQWSSSSSSLSSSSSKPIPDDAIAPGKNKNQEFQRNQNNHPMRGKQKWDEQSSCTIQKNRSSHNLSQSQSRNDLFLEEAAALSEVCQNIELKVY